MWCLCGVPCEIRVTDCVQCTLALPDPDIDTDITITTNTTDTDTDTNTNTYTNTDTDTNINTKTYTETFLSQVFQLGFWCRKRQIWSTHRVDWDGNLKQCYTQTV